MLSCSTCACEITVKGSKSKEGGGLEKMGEGVGQQVSTLAKGWVIPFFSQSVVGCVMIVSDKV